jgi:hypothetical protein
MTDDATIWRTLQEFLPKRTWISLSDIYGIVQSRVLLDKEDLEHQTPSSGFPQWKANVRRLLRAKARIGRIRARRRAAGDC